IESIMIALVAEAMENIKIDIAAQTMGSLDINIAEAITLNIDIAAQTIDDLKINIDAQSVGIFSQADWAAKEGTGWDDSVYDTNIARGQDISGVDTVPTGKTLLITGFTFGIWAEDEADSDKNQIGEAVLQDTVTGKILVDMGGNGGGCAVVSKPMTIPSGHSFNYSICPLSPIRTNSSIFNTSYAVITFLGSAIIPPF
ncbi:unnamed protein product, partial [marine sediment metagenome]